MSDLWEAAWTSLNEDFRALAATVESTRPQLVWSCGHSDNESFAFRAYASFGHNHENPEDVVISVDFHHAGDELHFSSDVAKGDGELLSDGPRGVIDKPLDSDSSRTQVVRAISQIGTFVRASTPVIVHELD